ncbi:MAG: hypothetical protein ACTSR3_03040 [Candidatus Helarchaeota archaeon]
MRKQKLLFFAVGLPLYIFYFFIISQFYIVFSALYFIPFLVIAIATFRHRDFYLRATKLSILLFLVFIMMYPNIPDWGNQIYRRVNRGSVIEPYNPFFFTLNQSFHVWFNDTHGMSFDEVTDEIEKVQYISNFIYNPWYRRKTLDPKYFSLIHYTYDYNYPRLAWDHLPTVSEIINNGFTSDCTGIAVFTTSFLIYMGYDAYLTEGDFHEFTTVFINGTSILSFIPTSIRLEPYRLFYYVAMNPIYLNWWPDVGEPYLMFNYRFLIIPRSVFSSLGDVYTDNYIFEDFYLPILNGEYITPFVSWPLVIAAFLGISFLINYYNKFPRRKKPQREDLPNILFGWSIITAGAIILFLLCAFKIFTLGFIIASLTFFVVFIASDRDYPKRLKLFERFTTSTA